MGPLKAQTSYTRNNRGIYTHTYIYTHIHKHTHTKGYTESNAKVDITFILINIGCSNFTCWHVGRVTVPL